MLNFLSRVATQKSCMFGQEVDEINALLPLYVVHSGSGRLTVYSIYGSSIAVLERALLLHVSRTLGFVVSGQEHIYELGNLEFQMFHSILEQCQFLGLADMLTAKKEERRNN